MKNVWEMLKGKKTYLVAGVMFMYAISGLILGHLTSDQAFQVIMAALATAGIRHGITTQK